MFWLKFLFWEMISSPVSLTVLLFTLLGIWMINRIEGRPSFGERLFPLLFKIPLLFLRKPKGPFYYDPKRPHYYDSTRQRGFRGFLVRSHSKAGH